MKLEHKTLTSIVTTFDMASIQAKVDDLVLRGYAPLAPMQPATRISERNGDGMLYTITMVAHVPRKFEYKVVSHETAEGLGDLVNLLRDGNWVPADSIIAGNGRWVQALVRYTD